MFQSRTAKVLLLACGQTLSFLAGILSAAVFSRIFSKPDYATYRQALLAFAMAAPFVTLGLNYAPYYFLPNNADRSRQLLLENIALLSIGGLLLALFICLGGNRFFAGQFDNPQLVFLLLVMAVYPMLTLPANSFNAVLMAQGHASWVASFTVVSRLVMLAMVVVPGLIWRTPAAALWGTMTGAAINTTISLFLMFRVCPTGPLRISAKGLYDQFAFSLPLGLGSLSAYMVTQLDKYVVSHKFDKATAAIYFNGAMELPFISILVSSIASVLITDYRVFFLEGRFEEMRGVFRRAYSKCALVIFPCFCFCFCMAPELMRLLFGPGYVLSSEPFRIYLLVMPIRIISFGSILQATGNSRYIFFLESATLLAYIPMLWIGTGYFGYLGAAWCYVLSTYLVYVPLALWKICSVVKAKWGEFFDARYLFKVFALSFLPAAVVYGVFYPFPLDRLAEQFAVREELLVFAKLALGGSLFLLLLLGGMQYSELVDVKLLISRIKMKLARAA